MSEKKKLLRHGRDCLAAKNYREAVQNCKAVLKEDRSCYEAHVYIGKAAYHLGEFEQAEVAYQKATEINDKAAQAWQGLSELYHDTQQWVKAADTDQTLVDLAHRGDASLASKLPYLVRRLGEAHKAAGQLEEAEVALRDVLRHQPPLGEKLQVLALLADVQLKEDSAELEVKIQQRLQEKIKAAGGDTSKVCEDAVRFSVVSEAADEAMELDCDHATPTLKELVCSVAPTPLYVKYHDTYLRRLRQAVNVAASGSMDRHNRRVAVLEVCRAMIDGRCAANAVGMGCASPYAYETALRLLEIEEEIAGACLPRQSSQDWSATRGPFSGVASPRSGLATPTAAGLAAAVAANVSPGSFFGGSSMLNAAARIGSIGGGLNESLSLMGVGTGYRSGVATPGAAGLTGTGMTSMSSAGNLSGLVPTAPATPKRIMSGQQLSELVHNPMAGASAAATGTMADQERESFGQLAAEASGVMSAAATTANGTADATPFETITPAGSLGTGALSAQQSISLAAASLSVVGAPGGLRVSIGGGTSLASRYSSQELTAASPRTNTTPRFSTTPLTPRAAQPPAAAPLLMADSEMLARKLMHAFPWNATAHVHMAMALRRRESYIISAAATVKLQCDWQGPGVTDLSCSAMAQRMRAERPRQQARRAWLANLMAKGLERGAPVVAGMIGLAELRMEAGDSHGALEAAKRGLKFVFDRSKIAKERARHAALVLNLLAAQALLGTGQVTDAGRIFVRLAQRVSEGEIAFGSDAVGMPATSIRQQAIRGLAQVALAQGDTCQALHHYGELVSKALMGRGSAEHWAYAEYGWLLFQEGNADAGRYQLETALDVMYKQTGGHGMESVAADYHFKLGRIYWALGGNYKSDREYCHAHLLDAAAEEGPRQAAAFEWLGHWYSQVAGDELRARKCYQRALALDPTLEGAGVALCSQLHTSSVDNADAGLSGIQLELQLLQEILIRAPDAQWARARLARLQLQMGIYEEAVASHQAAIRAAPKSAELWEGLAASYEALGRHASALKSYNRTLELDPARPYALMSSGALEYMVGAYDSAAAKYKAALQLLPQHPAALLGLAEVLLSSACKHVAMGAAGAAAVELSQAAEVARAAATEIKTAVAPSDACAVAGASDKAHAATPATANGVEQQRPTSMSYTTNLVTAWKLLGDILLQQHMLQPTAAAACVSEPSAADDAVHAALKHLEARRHLLSDARRAYARALRLHPASGEVWGDVALCYSHEAQLLQQLQPGSQQIDTGISSTAACATAVRTARGGLRLSPASSWLWGVLAGAAAAAGDAASAEYAYSRALALDSKAAALWVQLGRLYSRHGSVELAEQCYEAARGAEPTLVSVWEAMAATAALSGSSAGSSAAAAAAEHAVGLGGGPESWLGYATAGLRGYVPPDTGLLLACASKASSQQPLLLPAHAVLAAAMEACKQYTSAIAALQYCLALLDARAQDGPEGFAALGLAGLSQGTLSSTYSVLLLQSLGLEGPSDTVVSPETVTAALQTALARNFCLAGRHQEAVELYDRLESQGILRPASVCYKIHSLLCFGYAAQQLGKTELSRDVLERAAAEAVDDLDKIDAVRAVLQHHLRSGALEAGFSLLLQHLPQLSSSSPVLAEAGMRAWLSLLVAAATLRQHDVQAQVEEVMRQAAHGALQHLDWAWVECELQCIRAAGQAAAGHKSQAVQQLAHAVHTCPWHVPARIRLASQALATNPRLAQSAYRACPGLQPEAHRYTSTASSSSATQPIQQQQVAQYPGQQTGLASSRLQELAVAEALAAASCRATALSGQVAAAAAADAGREVCRLTRLVHALPNSPDVWFCLALVAVLRAVGSRQAAHYRFAQKCCLSALQQINRLVELQQQQQKGPSEQKQQNASLSNSSSLERCNLSQLKECRIRLMVAVSECHQHSRLPGCHDSAHQWAMDALAAAMAAGGVGSAAAHRQVGRMLAFEGMLTEAEMALRQAAAASGERSAEAVLELAKLLANQDRQQEATQLLHGVWQAATAGDSSAEGAHSSDAAVSGGGPHYVEVAALEEALLLAELGQWEGARLAAAAGLKLATAAGAVAPAAAELVTASVALQAAAAAPPDSFRNLILEARWAASSAAKSGVALPGTVGSAAAGLGAAVLAQVELARGKPEKAYDAIGMSIGAWVDQAVPAQVLATAGELTGQVTDCAVAVHTAPWDRAGWERLNLAAAARG